MNELLISLGFNVVLSLLKNKKDRGQFYAVIAKVYVAIQDLMTFDSALAEAIELKRAGASQR